MTTVSSIITSVGYDLKLTSTEATARTNELISYMNRCISGFIIPLLARFKSDLGMKEWTTTESTAYLPKYTLPTDFYSFYALYAKIYEHAGTLVSAASSSSMVLDTDASTTDDAYNGMILRLTSGTYADEQRYITDYTGSTYTATTVAFTSTPSTNTFVIVEPFTADDELQQVEMDEFNSDYTKTAESPEVYSILTNTSLMIGPCPDTATVVFHGLYFYKPTALSATTDTLPFHGAFDETIRVYTTQMALLRDEYNVSVEESIRNRIDQDLISIIKERVRRKPGVGQSKMRGSED
jgi:hypothetical protein